MIKQLQRKFILILMSFVCVLLLGVFGVVCYVTYVKDNEEVSKSLYMALKNGNDDFYFDFNQNNDRNFNTNSFVLYTDSDYSYLVTKKSVWNIYADDAEKLVALVEDEDNSGVLKDMGFAYKKKAIYNYSVDENTTITSGYAIAFVDITNLQTSFKHMLYTSIEIGIFVLVVFFILSYLLSSWALKPVEEAWSKQKQFVADASHELKTPLTVILADSDVLLNHDQDSIFQQKQWITSIQSEANRMRKLVENMLFLAKNDANKMKVEMQNCSLSDICFHCVLPFESIAFEKGIELIDEVEENIEVHGDEAQLKQLVLIFLDNAIKYTPKGGKIYFNLCLNQGKPQIKIRNTDSYIPPEELSHIFERFYRMDKSRKYEGGAGLGLSIATQIAKVHKIKIHAASTKEAGTTFTLDF